MIEYIEDDQLWRIACDAQGCDEERLDPRNPAGTPDDAWAFLRRAAAFWGFRELNLDGKRIHLCAEHGREKDRADQNKRFRDWWRDTVEPKIDAARAAKHERERLGLT